MEDRKHGELRVLKLRYNDGSLDQGQLQYWDKLNNVWKSIEVVNHVYGGENRSWED